MWSMYYSELQNTILFYLYSCDGLPDTGWASLLRSSNNYCIYAFSLTNIKKTLPRSKSVHRQSLQLKQILQKELYSETQKKLYTANCLHQTDRHMVFISTAQKQKGGEKKVFTPKVFTTANTKVSMMKNWGGACKTNSTCNCIAMSIQSPVLGNRVEEGGIIVNAAYWEVHQGRYSKPGCHR